MDSKNPVTNARKAAGLTQAQLAASIGCNIRSIQKYEGGENSIENMPLSRALALCRVLHIDVHQLLPQE